MAESTLTKRVLAQSLKELMQKTPLSKISVSDITDYCGVNRNTFYYHFKDKYELVNWIYYTETLEQISAYTDLDHWEEGLCKLCLYMQENRRFYINALSVTGQNSFSEYLVDFYYNLLVTFIEEVPVSPRPDGEDVRFAARFYTYAFVGLICEWARDGMRDDPVPRVRRIKEIIYGNLIRELEARAIEKT